MTEGTDKPSADAQDTTVASAEQAEPQVEAAAGPAETAPPASAEDGGGSTPAQSAEAAPEQPPSATEAAPTDATVSPSVESPPVQPAAPEIPQGNGELVLVTDGANYVGAHVVSQLLQSGQFRVRAAVADPSDEAKVAALKGLSPAEPKYPIDVVEAGSASKAEAWDAAFKDCELAICTTHAEAGSVADEAAIQAAVDATLAILKAAHAARTVKRVVLTSSIAAITQGHGESKKKFTEDDWSEAEKVLDVQAKLDTLVEKAAWAYVKDLPDNERFELVAINPGYVLGPPLISTSENNADVVRRLLNRDDRMLPKLNFNVVDVRDVALAHVRALTLPVAGARHILVSHNVWLRDIAVILAKEFKKQGFSVPTTQAPYLVLWMKAQFDPSVKSILPLVNHLHETDTKRMKEALFIQPRDLKETVIDTASGLIEKEVVKKVEKKPSRRFSLRRSKKEAKDESKAAAEGGEQQPATDGTEAGEGGGAAVTADVAGGSSDDGKKKKASPKKKSDKKKKGAATVVEPPAEPAAAAAAPADAEQQASPPEASAATGEEAPTADAAAETAAAAGDESEAVPQQQQQPPQGDAAAAAEQVEPQHHQAGVPNGDVCKEATSSPTADASPPAAAETPAAETAPLAGGDATGSAAAADGEVSAADGSAAPAAQPAAEEPAAITAC